MSELSIVTTQNVNINFKQASVGERIWANIFDLMLKIAYAWGFSYLIFEVFRFNEVVIDMDHWSQMGILVIFYSPIIFYSLVLESIFEGQTIGKRIAKIKVVKIDGYQAGFGDYLIRWLFRIIDILIGSGIIGLISIILSPKSQRLGDMAAGTAVISLKNDITFNSTIFQEFDDHYIPTYPLVIRFSDNDIRIIKETFNKARKTNDRALIGKLVEKVESVTGIKNQSGNTHDFLTTIIKDYTYYTQNM